MFRSTNKSFEKLAKGYAHSHCQEKLTPFKPDAQIATKLRQESFRIKYRKMKTSKSS